VLNIFFVFNRSNRPVRTTESMVGRSRAPNRRYCTHDRRESSPPAAEPVSSHITSCPIDILPQSTKLAAMKIIRSMCCLLIVVASVSCSKSKSPHDGSKPVDGANPLNRLVGTWSVSTALHQPDKDDVISTGQDRCEWLGSSATLACTYQTDNRKFTGFAVRSWAPETGVVSGYWMTSDNTYGPLQSTGHFNPSTGALDELEVGLDPNGKPMKLRMVRSYSSADEGLVKYTMIHKDGTEMPAFTSTLKRKSE